MHPCAGNPKLKVGVGLTHPREDRVFPPLHQPSWSKYLWLCPALAPSTLWRPGCMWKGGKGAEWATVTTAAVGALEKDDTEAFLSNA